MPSEHAPGPTNPADLQNFFNRIFKGGPPNDMPANGSFFPPGPPHHHPPGAGAAPFPPPPSQTGFFMPGGPRSESSDTWAESGKPPRRRRKVRKPFQRWNRWLLVYSNGNAWTHKGCPSMAVFCQNLNWRQQMGLRLQFIKSSLKAWISKKSWLTEGLNWHRLYLTLFCHLFFFIEDCSLWN